MDNNNYLYNVLYYCLGDFYHIRKKNTLLCKHWQKGSVDLLVNDATLQQCYRKKKDKIYEALFDIDHSSRCLRIYHVPRMGVKFTHFCDLYVRGRKTIVTQELGKVLNHKVSVCETGPDSKIHTVTSKGKVASDVKLARFLFASNCHFFSLRFESTVTSTSVIYGRSFERQWLQTVVELFSKFLSPTTENYLLKNNHLKVRFGGKVTIHGVSHFNIPWSFNRNIKYQMTEFGNLLFNNFKL